MLLLGRKKEEESMCNVTSQVISEEEEAARSKGSNFPLFPRREKERRNITLPYEENRERGGLWRRYFSSNSVAASLKSS